jgi:hypothetical protein
VGGAVGEVSVTAGRVTGDQAGAGAVDGAGGSMGGNGPTGAPLPPGTFSPTRLGGVVAGDQAAGVNPMPDPVDASGCAGATCGVGTEPGPVPSGSSGKTSSGGHTGALSCRGAGDC